MIDLSSAASFQEGDVLFGDGISQSRGVLERSALTAALCQAAEEGDLGDALSQIDELASGCAICLMMKNKAYKILLRVLSSIIAVRA
jgi:hypothetical protein